MTSLYTRTVYHVLVGDSTEAHCHCHNDILCYYMQGLADQVVRTPVTHLQSALWPNHAYGSSIRLPLHPGSQEGGEGHHQGPHHLSQGDWSSCQPVHGTTPLQIMGQLPSARVTPSPPFSNVGVDFTGPLLCKRGNPRNPTLVKMYICVFVCFVTKAVHLEPVMDLTTEAFLAVIWRFVARRGHPSRTNFTGANRELKEIYELLASDSSQQRINHFSSSQQIQWLHSPSRAPHFGDPPPESCRDTLPHTRGTIDHPI